jgi:hypothetical protein
MTASTLPPVRIIAIGAFTSGAADWDMEAPGSFTFGALTTSGNVADLFIASIAVLSSSVLVWMVKGRHSIGTMLMVRIDGSTLSLGIICEDMQPDMKTPRRTARIQCFISTPLMQLVDVCDEFTALISSWHHH